MYSIVEYYWNYTLFQFIEWMIMDCKYCVAIINMGLKVVHG